MVAEQQGEAPIVIKKYANRRLYNTATSSYVTLDHLCEMVKRSEDFVVYDAKSGEDITRSVLTQIIVEEESKGGQNLLPIRFLRQLISYYGEGIPQSVLPNYLEIVMENFSQNQEKLQSYMAENMGSVFPFGNLEEIGRQNMAMFEQAMKMFAPFAGGIGMPDAGQGESAKSNMAAQQSEAKTASTKASDASADLLNDMQKQLAEMQKKLAEMEKK
ncbi:MAG: polyhydroxyalkanoate synthesis repressor PhaR [Alphaproteobacteria bacterium]|nr:polyhydroxyalkanoate synthesis repressor PhaR [Alphaproteobacteria bacterium]